MTGVGWSAFLQLGKVFRIVPWGSLSHLHRPVREKVMEGFTMATLLPLPSPWGSLLSLPWKHSVVPGGKPWKCEPPLYCPAPYSFLFSLQPTCQNYSWTVPTSSLVPCTRSWLPHFSGCTFASRLQRSYLLCDLSSLMSQGKSWIFRLSTFFLL